MSAKFKTVKQVTMPLIKFGSVPIIVRFDSAIYIGEKLEGGTAAQRAMEPPHMAHVTDMETGEVGVVIFGAVLLKEIEKHYPKESYVGKFFAIAKKSPPEGDKKYSLWSVVEVAPEEEKPETVSHKVK